MKTNQTTEGRLGLRTRGGLMVCPGCQFRFAGPGYGEACDCPNCNERLHDPMKPYYDRHDRLVATGAIHEYYTDESGESFVCKAIPGKGGAHSVFGDRRYWRWRNSPTPPHIVLTALGRRLAENLKN